ncbi:MAG: hypothetical protein D6677_00385 [Calditrichaeota bacterium]|nr:MAG: hypothetical protein D6677_00385 [Calditrichota bacterium]
MATQTDAGQTIVGLLERIAVSLETIADALENKTPPAGPVPGGKTDVVKDEKKSAPPPRDADILKAFLEKRGVQIVSVPEEDASDDLINSLALFLGKNYPSLQEFLGKVKRHMARGGSFSLNMTEYGKSDVSNVCQFANRLHEYAFLEQYRYERAPHYLLRAKTTALPAAQNFFSGKWMERYVLQVVIQVVNKIANELRQALDFGYLINPKVVLPNGQDFEFDIFFHVNGTMFWVEAKSGGYQQHISKYSKIAGMLNMERAHAIVALTDMPRERCRALSSLYNMSVTTLEDFEAFITHQILGVDGLFKTGKKS